jgi:lysophospholipase L1-like esterase
MRLSGYRAVLPLVASLVAACGGGGGGGSSGGGPALPAPTAFYASWTSSAQDLTEGLPGGPHVTPDVIADRTVTQFAHLSVGGDTLRLTLSNRFGTAPLAFDSVHIARALNPPAIDATSDHAVTFAGSTVVTIPIGAEATSDPVALPVSALSDVAVTVHVPSVTALTTGHKTLPANLLWLTGIDASSSDATHVVVAFGDSITDGSQSTPGAHKSYPEQLAARVAGSVNPRMAVVDAGIGGNRWLQDDPGPAGITRFDHDVLAVTGVTHVIILLGINDFEVARAFGQPPVTAEALEAATTQAIAHAKAKHVKVLLGTLTSYKGSALFNADDEAQREAYNAWVRQNKEADAIVDFDAALRDPADPQSLAAQFASPDHLHPNDAGYGAMAAAVDLTTLR